MSYCVNCGVELDGALRDCPLCRCPVINPLAGAAEKTAAPRKVDAVDSLVERRFVAVVMTVILVFASLICLLIDSVYNKRVTWSAVVLGSFGLTWVCLPLALWPRRMGLRRAVTFDVGALLLFLWLLESQLEGAWFLTLALPIVISVTLVFLAVSTLVKRKALQGWRLAAGVLASCGLLTMSVEGAVGWYRVGHLLFQWSWLVMIPCAAAAAVMLVIDRKKPLQAALARRFHI
ncbi:MAG: DUF6320 domain-containing protein [Oscillospiraceae bacterium]|jgi:hypothetical protein|nr:DUF6320 domain-containing protein [Oscillospiraceae bacterium]